MAEQPPNAEPGDRSPRAAPRDRKTWLPKVSAAGLTAIAEGVLLVIVVGAGLTYYFLAPRSEAAPGEGGRRETAADSGPTTWTCSMHPQIKLPNPGQCPICFMDLIPLEDDGGEDLGPRQLKMSETATALAEIQTTPVARRYAAKPIRMVGKVDYDETRLADIAAWVAGRLDRLFVDYTGVTVRKGDHLVEMYSPDLIVAQRELLQAMGAAERLDELDPKLSAANLASAEEKLRLLGVLPEQIAEIKRRGTPSERLTIHAPVGGVVVRKHANEGTYVTTGTKIYTIAELSVVWVYLEAYESDVAWLRYGQEVEFATEAYPGEIFRGRIAFIDPVLDERTRTVEVRLNVPNAEGKLKPGMFVRASVRSHLAAGGRVFDPSLIGKWISPMHPEVVKDGPGKCDVCGMDLVPAAELGYAVPDEAPDRPLVIPDTAPLVTGKRAVVYVQLPDREQPTFEGREVLLGPRAGDEYVVRHGLEEGELVVTQGNFKIDSALQIQAKPSMMNPEDDAADLANLADAAHGQADPPNVPAAFRSRLNPLLAAYLAAAAALAADDLKAAKEALDRIAPAVEAVDATPLDEHARSLWQRHADALAMASLEAADANERDEMRRHFGELSRAATSLVSLFGHALDGPLYQFHCPMARDAKGADWLQPGEEVRNPYYGPAMLRCGELEATYASQAPLDVPPEFHRQLADVYDAYLALQTSLADDRLNDAREALAALRRALESVDASTLEGRTLAAWQSAAEALAPALAEDASAADLEALRSRFEPISEVLLDVVDAFGHLHKMALHRAFCPMAFDNRGAAWLQAGEQIANPYFGHQMLRCGVIQSDFPSAAPAGDDPTEEEVRDGR